MKEIYLMGVMLLTFIMVSCTQEDYSDANESGLPQVELISDAISISVNQKTNEVTFELTTSVKGCFPVWQFEAGYTDANASSTLSKVTKTYPEKGDYTVTVRLGNKEGLSKDSIKKTFHINKDLQQ